MRYCTYVAIIFSPEYIGLWQLCDKEPSFSPDLLVTRELMASFYVQRRHFESIQFSVLL